jgi:transcriptional regulator with XRE-family HTH domain
MSFNRLLTEIVQEAVKRESQAIVAERCGVSQPYISMIVHNRRKNFSAKTVEKILRGISKEGTNEANSDCRAKCDALLSIIGHEATR